MEHQTLALLILSVVAPIGAIDALYFHVWRFRLATRPESRWETLTHVARSVVLGIVAPLIALYEPHGAWFWFVAGLLVVDFANNLLDAALEGDSRAGLGGIPRGEYLIHIAGAAMVGAASLAFMVAGWPHALSATALVPAVMPGWLVLNAVVIGLGSFAFAGLELTMLAASRTRSRSRSTLSPS